MKYILVLCAAFLLVILGCNNNEKVSSESYLNPTELRVYENLKRNLDESLLENLEPISIAKLYVYSGLNADHDIKYFLYTQREDYIAWSKEEDQKIPDKDRGTREQILSTFKNIEQGDFILVSDYEGYIEFESVPGQKSGFQMIQDESGIWKVAFMPIQ